LYGFSFALGCYLVTLLLVFIGLFFNGKGRRVSGWSLILSAIGFDVIGGLALGVPWLQDEEDCQKNQGTELGQHHLITVTQKLLTMLDYCNTLIPVGRAHMANVLSTDKQIAVIAALAEGSSIRSIERITGVHRDTIMRLGVRVGKGCQTLLDRKMRDLPCKQLQFDEI
jgi:hypothetical protein